MYSLATGASYIKLPQKFPPTGADSQWLEAEGIKALILGGRKWVPGSETGLVVSPKSRMRRDIVSRLRGTAYITPPSRWRYPDTITVNATEYDDGGLGSLIYVSASGETLNLTHLDRWYQ